MENSDSEIFKYENIDENSGKCQISEKLLDNKFKTLHPDIEKKCCLGLFIFGKEIILCVKEKLTCLSKKKTIMKKLIKECNKSHKITNKIMNRSESNLKEKILSYETFNFGFKRRKHSKISNNLIELAKDFEKVGGNVWKGSIKK